MPYQCKDNLSGAKTGIFPGKLKQQCFIRADALAPSNARWPADMVLAIQDKQVLVLCGEGFQLPV